MKIIVGLGNPGPLYQWSRHNLGFLVLDNFSEKTHIPISSNCFHAIYGIGWINSEKVVLAKPMVFMNRSGTSVKKILEQLNAILSDLLIIHDDLDLPFGRIRFKRKGGDGGHQGVRSVINSLGDHHFLRMKIGIGRPPKEIDPADYVLSQFDEIEKSQLRDILDRAAEALKVFILEGIDLATNRFQKR